MAKKKKGHETVFTIFNPMLQKASDYVDCYVDVHHAADAKALQLVDEKGRSTICDILDKQPLNYTLCEYPLTALWGIPPSVIKYLSMRKISPAWDTKHIN